MSDEATGAYSETVAVLSDNNECNSIINKQRSDWRVSTIGISSANNSVDNESSNYNRCGQVELTATTTVVTTMAPAVRTTTSPTSFTTPSIAVTASATETTSAIALKRTGGKRSTKIDFVRFDSVETIFKQSDHEDVIQRAGIKDEIKK